VIGRILQAFSCGGYDLGVDASCARGHGPKRAWIGQRAVLCCQATEMSPDGVVAVLA